MTCNEDTPEFDVFKRIENIEARMPKEFTEEDIAIIAAFGLELAFGAYCLHAPKIARKIKDQLLGKLKTAGLNKRMFDMLEEDLNNICDSWD